MFNKIKLTILSPDKSKDIIVEVNEILTVSQVIDELVQNKFIPIEYNYGLLIESDGLVLSPNSTLYSVSDESTIRIIKSAVRTVMFSEKQIVNGKKINVTILHPTTGSDMEVELNDGLTVEEIISELIACNFIEDSTNKSNYEIFIKNSQTNISGSQTLASGGAVNGSILQVIIEMYAS